MQLHFSYREHRVLLLLASRKFSADYEDQYFVINLSGTRSIWLSGSQSGRLLCAIRNQLDFPMQLDAEICHFLICIYYLFCGASFY